MHRLLPFAAATERWTAGAKLARDDLERLRPGIVPELQIGGLDAGRGKTAQAIDDFGGGRAGAGDIGAGLFDFVVVAANPHALRAEHVEFVRQIWGRVEPADIAIPRDGGQISRSPPPAIMISGRGRVRLCGTLSARSSRICLPMNG